MLKLPPYGEKKMNIGKELVVTFCREFILAIAIARIACSCPVSLKLIGSLVNLSLFAVTTEVSQYIHPTQLNLSEQHLSPGLCEDAF